VNILGLILTLVILLAALGAIVGFALMPDKDARPTEAGQARKTRRYALPRWSVGLVAVVAVLGIGAFGGYKGVSAVMAKPAQPLLFSHRVHVQTAKLDCTFCHRDALTSQDPGIPAVEQCMACHSVVSMGNPDIDKVRAAWANKQPLDWARVNRLPDHVQFVHNAHIQAGFTCQTCHGDVGSMVQVQKVRSLKMGDCMSCHRQNNAPTECSTCHK
jgi:hypothetical protein